MKTADLMNLLRQTEDETRARMQQNEETDRRAEMIAKYKDVASIKERIAAMMIAS